MVRPPDGVLENRRAKAEGALERSGILHEQAAHLVWLEQPLVGVQPDRVGSLDAAEKLTALVRDRREAAVGSIHVEPDVLRLAEIRHRPQRIDRSRARRPGIGADRHGRKARVAVLRHGTRESPHVQAEGAVRRDLPNGILPDADDHRGTSLRAVALVAHVHRWTLRIAGRFPGRHEGVDAGGGTAAGQQPARTFGVAQPASKPVQHDEFDLARTARDQPGAGVHVPRGGQKVRDHTGPCRFRRNEAEAAWVVQPGRHREDVLHGPLQDLLSGATFLRRLLEQNPFEPFLELPVPGVLARQALDPRHRKLSRLCGQSQHGLRRHPEVGTSHSPIGGPRVSALASLSVSLHA